MSHFITSHDTNGQAVFSDRVPEQQHEMEIPNVGTIKNIYSTHNFPMDLSSEDDIERYAYDQVNRLPKLCPDKGTFAGILSLAPGAESAMHRTMTIDALVVIEGVIELRLDSGQKRVVKVGDSVVMRGTMHQWANVTPHGGWARMVGFAQATVSPIEVSGKRLDEEYIK